MMTVTVQEMGTVTVRLEGDNKPITLEELVRFWKEGHKAALEGRISSKVHVRPGEINRQLFLNVRDDPRQEAARQFFVKVLEAADANPEKYSKNFTAMKLKKLWECKTVGEQKAIAKEIADGQQDKVQWGLQKMSVISSENGSDAAWAKQCNEPDTEEYYSCIKWDDGFSRLAGGSLLVLNSSPPMDVYDDRYDDDLSLSQSMVVAVLYEE